MTNFSSLQLFNFDRALASGEVFEKFLRSHTTHNGGKRARIRKSRFGYQEGRASARSPSAPASDRASVMVPSLCICRKCKQKWFLDGWVCPEIRRSPEPAPGAGDIDDDWVIVEERPLEERSFQGRPPDGQPLDRQSLDGRRLGFWGHLWRFVSGAVVTPRKTE